MILLKDASITLQEIERDIWQKLSEGTDPKRTAFRYGTLATQGINGPQQRTVVLRQVQPHERILLFYTDQRSAKVSELIAHPVVSWLFYDEATQTQIRLKAKATLHTRSALADACWVQVPLSNRQEYMSPLAPSTPQPGPPAESNISSISPEESEQGRIHFTVVANQVHQIDWLRLNRQGHQRAQFYYSMDGLKASWVVP
jgi:pyridoxamine 5'-phosphate oxidase